MSRTCLTLGRKINVGRAAHTPRRPPQLKRVLEEFSGKVQGVEIDIELDQEIAKQAEVNGTPTVQLFFMKELINQWLGVKQRSEFKEAIEKLLR